MLKRSVISLGYGLSVALIANSYFLLQRELAWLWVLIPVFLWVFLFAGVFTLRSASLRMRLCYHGGLLLFVFEISTILSIAYHAILLFGGFSKDLWQFLWSGLLCACVEAAIFWNGMICVYLTSVQLGIKHRLVGALCGMIPIVNVIILNKILRIVFKELKFEWEKERLDAQRRHEQLCRTQYPILLVHGVFFRDSHFLNYWGRIPKNLKRHGAKIYYGNQPSAASVAECAQFLSDRIYQILRQTGCEKVNIIAHSKGGLDCRYAMAHLGMAPYLASLTTINTPHHGCEFADFLLSNAPEALKDTVSDAYNSALEKLGEENPDFMAAVNDLTATACILRNQDMPLPEGVFCQSFGSVMPKSTGGKFPLNLSYHLVKYFDGPNDGLVSEQSFAWGERYTLLEPKGQRGISHADMIDLNRENIEGFDVREFYVELVHDLKNRGL